MTRDRLWTYSRWLVSITAVAAALLILNYAAVSAWQTATLPGAEHPAVWRYAAYESFGQSISLLAVAILAAINIRPGWPYLKGKWTAGFLLVAILGILYPRIDHFLAIDKCLDAGGAWDYERQVCLR